MGKLGNGNKICSEVLKKRNHMVCLGSVALNLLYEILCQHMDSIRFAPGGAKYRCVLIKILGLYNSGEFLDKMCNYKFSSKIQNHLVNYF